MTANRNDDIYVFFPQLSILTDLVHLSFITVRFKNGKRDTDTRDQGYSHLLQHLAATSRLPANCSCQSRHQGLLPQYVNGSFI
jgi:predicted Zn-dependent peptidase